MRMETEEKEMLTVTGLGLFLMAFVFFAVCHSIQSSTTNYNYVRLSLWAGLLFLIGVISVVFGFYSLVKAYRMSDMAKQGS